MTNIEDNTLVVKDAAGNLFLVPHEMLEQGRVPEEQRAEIERLIGDADTSGFFASVFGAMYRAFASTATPDGKVSMQDILISKYSDSPSSGLF
jgi:hypothetical protein